MMKHIGFSPDRADALMMAFGDLPDGPGFYMDSF